MTDPTAGSLPCVEYGDPNLRKELWVDEHSPQFYKEGCPCERCADHHLQARKKGRCSQLCMMCFDALVECAKDCPSCKETAQDKERVSLMYERFGVGIFVGFALGAGAHAAGLENSPIIAVLGVFLGYLWMCRDKGNAQKR